MSTQNTEYLYKDLILDILYLIEETTKLYQLVKASQNAMHVIDGISKDLIGRDKPTSETGQDQNFNNIIASAKIVRKEIDNEFQFLNTQCALMLYAYLEATIKRLIKSFIKLNKNIEIKEITDVQIKLHEYMNLDENDRYEYLYQQYEKKNAIGLLYGLTRFETLLAPIGLSGKVSEEIKRNIFELSQVRNLIIHNGGVADRHFVKNCPWLKTTNGQKLLIDQSLIDKYWNAVNSYGQILSFRIAGKDNPDLPEISERVI